MVRLLFILLFSVSVCYGQANRFAGFGYKSTCDADAQIFIDSTRAKDTVQIRAICTLVKQLKDSSLWNSMKAIYPFVGGSATVDTLDRYRFNLKDPRYYVTAPNAAYCLVYGGGATSTILGLKGNGANSYANTSFIPANDFDSIQGNSFGAVIVNNIDAVQLPMGIRPNSGNALSFSTRISNIAYSGNVGAQLSVTNTDARGVYISTRTNRSTSKFFRNGTLLINNGAYVPDAYTIPIYLLARNYINSPEFIITNTIGFAFIGSALTDAQASTLYNIINTFKNTLGR